MTFTSISLNLSHLAVIKIDSTSFPHTAGDSLAVIVSSLTVSNELFTVFTVRLHFFLRTFFFFGSIWKHSTSELVHAREIFLLSVSFEV